MASKILDKNLLFLLVIFFVADTGFIMFPDVCPLMVEGISDITYSCLYWLCSIFLIIFLGIKIYRNNAQNTEKRFVFDKNIKGKIFYLFSFHSKRRENVSNEKKTERIKFITFTLSTITIVPLFFFWFPNTVREIIYFLMIGLIIIRSIFMQTYVSVLTTEKMTLKGFLFNIIIILLLPLIILLAMMIPHELISGLNDVAWCILILIFFIASYFYAVGIRSIYLISYRKYSNRLRIVR